MTIPEELFWIQKLIDTYQVTGTLRLMVVHCGDRAAEPDAPAYWSHLAEILAETAQRTRRVEPERMTR